MIGLSSRHRINPPPTRFLSRKASGCKWQPRRYQADPCSRGGEVARGVLLSSKPRRKVYFLPSERRTFVACFLHSSAQMCLYQTPGGRPPRITRRFGNTAVTIVQISWRSRWCCWSISVEDSESRRFELTFGWVLSGRSWPNISPEIIFLFFLNVWNFLFKICAHSERYRHLLADIFELQTSLGNIAFRMSSVRY